MGSGSSISAGIRILHPVPPAKKSSLLHTPIPSAIAPRVNNNKGSSAKPATINPINILLLQTSFFPRQRNKLICNVIPPRPTYDTPKSPKERLAKPNSKKQLPKIVIINASTSLNIFFIIIPTFRPEYSAHSPTICG